MKIIKTSEFLIDGMCVGCNTNITRYNSFLSNDGVRTCKICGSTQENGWRVEIA